MSRRWIVLAVILLVWTPSAIYARWIEDKVTLETQEVGKVEFSHFIHLEAVGKNCPACHNEIYHIVTKNNPAFTMKEMEAGKACGACHKGKEAFSVKEQCDSRHDGSTAFGVKDDKFCGKCHEM